jgi:hypothetical protein
VLSQRSDGSYVAYCQTEENLWYSFENKEVKLLQDINVIVSAEV